MKNVFPKILVILTLKSSKWLWKACSINCSWILWFNESYAVCSDECELFYLWIDMYMWSRKCESDLQEFKVILKFDKKCLEWFIHKALVWLFSIKLKFIQITQLALSFNTINSSVWICQQFYKRNIWIITHITWQINIIWTNKCMRL